MQPITSQKLCEILNYQNPVVEVVVDTVSTDSRSVKQGDLFIALRGENFDAHNFVPEVIAKGAALVVVEHIVEGVSLDRQIVVPNSLHAFGKIGAYNRSLYKGVVIGLTGSAGKTTTKEEIKFALGRFGKTYATSGNHNNNVGVPITLCNMDMDAEYAVIEMGMSEEGEMARLAAVARPQTAVVTNIGVAHIGQLGTRENIRKEKLDLIREFPDGGVLILNGDDPLLSEIAAVHNGMTEPERVCLSERAGERLAKAVVRTYGTGEDADYRASDIRLTPQGTRFTFTSRGGDGEEIELQAFGIHNVYNALAALAAADRFGIAAADAKKALKEWRPPRMRGTIEVTGGITLIDDTYNANPDSMKGAIDLLADLTGVTRRIAVLADMLELGELSGSCHREIGEYIVSRKEGAPDLVVLIGRESRHIAEAIREKGGRQQIRHFMENAEAAAYLKQAVRPGDAVVIKGSRSMKLDEVADALRSYGQE